MKILVVEDNERVAQFVRKGLAEDGHVVDTATTPQGGLHLAQTRAYDVIVLDRKFPGAEDGLIVVSALRARKDATPILILSALCDVDDRISGLRAGGDDYLVKPFAFGELSARVEALGRRPRTGASDYRLSLADLKLCLATRTVTRADKSILLKPREFKLLEYLLRHAGQVVTRTMIFESVWECDFDPQTNVIDTHISNLRQKIDAGFHPPLLHTVRGFGYRLSLDV